MNEKAFSLAGVTQDDYKKWCKENHKASYKPETKREFFAKIQSGRLAKDSSGRLVRKYKSK